MTLTAQNGRLVVDICEQYTVGDKVVRSYRVNGKVYMSFAEVVADYPVAADMILTEIIRQRDLAIDALNTEHTEKLKLEGVVEAVQDVLSVPTGSLRQNELLLNLAEVIDDIERLAQ